MNSEKTKVEYPSCMIPSFKKYEFTNCMLVCETGNENEEQNYVGKFQGINLSTTCNRTSTIFIYHTYTDGDIVTKLNPQHYSHTLKTRMIPCSYGLNYRIDDPVTSRLYIDLYSDYEHELLLLYWREFREKGLIPDVIYYISRFLRGTHPNGYELIYDHEKVCKSRMSGIDVTF